MADTNNFKEGHSTEGFMSSVMAMTHAFPNIYTVDITKLRPFPEPPPSSGIPIYSSSLVKISKKASKVNFGGNMGMTFDFQEASQFHAIKTPQRITKVTISFLESKDYDVVKTMKAWFDTMYDFTNRCFKSGNPSGKIVITDDITNQKYTITNVIPETLSYPTYAWSETSPISVDVVFAINGDITLD